MTPVCVYIDGFNLYHALLKFGDSRVKWLDLNALSHRLISPKTEKVQSIFYFSAFAHWLPAKMARHEIYVKALEARGVTCILGHFKNKERKCSSCGATWIAHEEKETDVSIGISLVNDAYKQRYEKAYLVTRDNACCADDPRGISNETDCRCRASIYGALERPDYSVPLKAKDQPGSGQSMLVA
jgi:hypothetical protein